MNSFLDYGKVLELARQLEEIVSNEAVEVELIDGLLAGHAKTEAWRKKFRAFCGIYHLKGVFLAEDNPDDVLLLNQILDACDADILSCLSEKYSASPQLMQLIRQKCKPDDNLCIEQAVQKSQDSFYQLLVKEMEKQGYQSDSEYYNSISFSRQTFSRMKKSSYTLSRENALHLTLGLTPKYQDVVKLLGAAGYALRKNIRREYIILYMIKNDTYTLAELNEMLVSFGEEPIGCE